MHNAHTHKPIQAQYKSVKSRCRWGGCCSRRAVSRQSAALVTNALAFFCCVSKLFVERGRRARLRPELRSKLVYFICSFQEACSTLLCSVFSWASNDSSYHKITHTLRGTRTTLSVRARHSAALQQHLLLLFFQLRVSLSTMEISPPCASHGVA